MDYWTHSIIGHNVQNVKYSTSKHYFWLFWAKLRVYKFFGTNHHETVLNKLPITPVNSFIPLNILSKEVLKFLKNHFSSMHIVVENEYLLFTQTVRNITSLYFIINSVKISIESHLDSTRYDIEICSIFKVQVFRHLCLS